jgi:hypothetical protein
MSDRKAQFSKLARSGSPKLRANPEVYNFLETMFLQLAARVDLNEARWRETGRRIVELCDRGDLAALRRLGVTAQQVRSSDAWLLPFARAVLPTSRLAVSRLASSAVHKTNLASGNKAREAQADTEALAKFAAWQTRVAAALRHGVAPMTDVQRVRKYLATRQVTSDRARRRIRRLLRDGRIPTLR